VLLQRLESWRVPQADAPNWLRVAGEAVGRLTVTRKQNQTTADLQATINEFTLAQYVPAEPTQSAGYRTLHQEPSAKIALQLAHDSERDQIQIATANWSADGLRGTLSGQINKVRAERALNLSGTVDYDLEKWGPLLAAPLGQDIRFEGHERATFQLAGCIGTPAITSAVPAAGQQRPPAAQPAASHWSRTLLGQFSLGWGAVHCFDLPPIPAGRLTAHLGDGAIALDPLHLALGQGELNARGSLQLDPSPQQLVAPDGFVLKDILITPQVSDRFLKFIAPVLADAIDTDGAFSLSLAGGRVPLATPGQADLSGELLVHAVRVMPGPLAREMLLVAEQIDALQKRRELPQTLSRPSQVWLAIDDCTIRFRVADGRVHHRGLEFRLGEVLVRSQGSVGFDESLDLALEIPILPRWVEKEPWLRGLADQPVRVAVRGTFQRPRIDRQALRDVTRQFLRGAARGAIEQNLGRALDKLLRPKQDD
jgi:hypothetical protein